MELISGLPDDVVRDCLIRVSYDKFRTVASVCKGWKAETELPEFRRRRKATGHSQKVLVMVQASVDLNKTTSVINKCPINPVYRLSVFEPDSGTWSELQLPPVPGTPGGLPMFCQLAGAGFDLVVMGGWDPVTWKASNSVFIYNFISARWRCGADMPGGPRTFFACASDLDRMVYVAGGHDEEKNALRSAMAYDVARNEWVPLPDMGRERDECKAIFHRGKFIAVGGYSTEMQGQFEKTAESFDVGTWRWDPVMDDFLDSATCPRTCVDGDDGTFYMCMDGDVLALEDSTWQAIAKLPTEMRNIAYVRTLQGKLLVIGSTGFGEPHLGFLLDMKNYTWQKLEMPEKYTGHVQSGCFLEI
ncbi:F-box/kelch-repeat protein [Quillaja saponaria]|uniref:F-box/kelch-repeat protein n=1 Tax=Quillaja saponaria TaxID=32244 RepID=A0AAD7LRU3_QUISA|nr:F-box/kelch-repeat protein [Quillaja saponaria]